MDTENRSCLCPYRPCRVGHCSSPISMSSVFLSYKHGVPCCPHVSEWLVKFKCLCAWLCERLLIWSRKEPIKLNHFPSESLSACQGLFMVRFDLVFPFYGFSIAFYICLFPGLCTIVFLISNTAWTVAWGLCTANCGWCQVYDIRIADYSFKWQLVTDVGLTREFTAALPHGLEWEGHFVWFSHHRLLLIPLLLPQTSSFPTGLSAVKKPQHCAFKMALPVIMFLCRQRYSRWKIAIITPVEIFPFNTVKLQLTHLDSN